MRPKREFSKKELSQITQLTGLGFPVARLAQFLGLSTRHFHRLKSEIPELRLAYQTGCAKAELEISRALWELVSQGNLAAIIWYEKTRLGRSERQEAAHQTEAKEGGGVVIYN